MKLQKTLTSDWPALLALAVPFILLALFWNRIPEEIPLHWNIEGQPDRWGPKGFEIFILPLASLGAYLILLITPYIDPKKRTESKQKSLKAMRLILPIFLTVLFIFTLLAWVGVDIQIGKSIGLVLTLFFIAIGNYLQSLRPNYFIGIRTPWTLESEDIWRKTHRLGGKIWVTGSVLMLVTWFFVPEPTFMVVLLVGLLTMALFPVGYSLYLYLKTRNVPS